MVICGVYWSVDPLRYGEWVEIVTCTIDQRVMVGPDVPSEAVEKWREHASFRIKHMAHVPQTADLWCNITCINPTNMPHPGFLRKAWTEPAKFLDVLEDKFHRSRESDILPIDLLSAENMGYSHSSIVDSD